MKGGDMVIKSKIFLMVVGILIILMGILGLLDIGMGTEPSWHAILKIIVGLAALVVAYMDRD
jgi:hypothetical protein